MCGIAALMRPSGGRVEPTELGRLADALGHRGPDDRGQAILDDGRVGLVATRLTIIDPHAPAQPYFNEDASIAAVVNGELYDYVELAASLRKRGHRLRSSCDAELVVHLYEELGPEFVAELDGDFALILWDARRRLLLASRDRIGVRPLYLHTRADGQLILASEVKAVAALGEPLALSPEYLCGHLFGAYDGRACAFAGVEALPAAALWTWSAKPERSVYWRWSSAAAGPSPVGSPSPASETLRAALERSVDQRLRTDVATGILFSGGLDSASIAALARARADLPAFCVGFQDPRFDESPRAQAHARALGLDLEVVSVRSEQLAEHLPQTIRALEFAPINAHCVARYLLARHVRARGIKVVLGGEGSDELFAGYGLFAAEARWRRDGRCTSEARGVGVGLVDDALDRPEHSPLAWASFFEARARRCDDVPARLLEPRWAGGLRPSERLFAGLSEPERAPALTLSREFALRQLHDYLIPALGDRVEMAHGLESRPVFLAREIIDLAARCDESALLDLERGQGKLLLRRAAAGLLPDTIRDVDKHPFLAPSWKQVLATVPGRGLLDRYLGRDAIHEFGVFRPNVLAFLLQRWNALPIEQAAGHRYDWTIGLALGVHILMDSFDLR